MRDSAISFLFLDVNNSPFSSLFFYDFNIFSSNGDFDEKMHRNSEFLWRE